MLQVTVSNFFLLISETWFDFEIGIQTLDGFASLRWQ